MNTYAVHSLYAPTKACERSDTHKRVGVPACGRANVDNNQFKR